ncbi:hypothetical protein F5887DRAFT_22 [Amanita rubescens]|nr:hypothetical protein F5887DRAFT_22 [Amanita rubescens]
MQASEWNPGDEGEFEPFQDGQRSLNHYRDSLCILYTAEADSYELRFERWKVFKIRTYKDRGTLAKHEYLVATLCNGDGRELELRMERRVQESSAINLITKSLSVLGSTSPRAAAADVTTSTGTQAKDDKFRKWAADGISVCSSSTFGDNQVQVDHFRLKHGHHVPLPRLVVLACAINEYCATYHITLSNCYWFCDVASRALKKRFDHTPEPVDDSGELGHWHGIPICPSNDIETVVTEVLENYDKSWDKFCSKVDQIVNNPRNKHTIDALQAVERETLRANQESDRADREEERRKSVERQLELYQAAFRLGQNTIVGEPLTQ